MKYRVKRITKSNDKNELYSYYIIQYKSFFGFWKDYKFQRFYHSSDIKGSIYAVLNDNNVHKFFSTTELKEVLDYLEFHDSDMGIGENNYNKILFYDLCNSNHAFSINECQALINQRRKEELQEQNAIQREREEVLTDEELKHIFNWNDVVGEL